MFQHMEHNLSNSLQEKLKNKTSTSKEVSTNQLQVLDLEAAPSETAAVFFEDVYKR